MASALSVKFLTAGGEARTAEVATGASILDAARAGGLGLGLSIIRGFVTAQGGEIVVGENPGGGAVFTVYLPHTPHGKVPNE